MEPRIERSSHRCFVRKICRSVLKTFRKVYRKTPVLESLFNKKIFFYEKEISTKVFSSEICKSFKNTYIEDHLRTPASESRY